VAGFCGSCGSPIAAGVKFCSKCGAAIPGAAVQPAIAASPAPPVSAGAPISSQPAPSQDGNTAVKVILIVLAIVMFLMLLAAGSCFYVAYRVKKKAHEISQEMGVNAPAYTGKRDPCLLSSNEVGFILHEPVEAGEARGDMACEYRYGHGGNRRLDIEFTWKGGTMAMKLANGAMKTISGVETFTAVPGIGDDAYIAPGGSGFMMRKGDVMVSIDLRASGVSLDAAEKIAAKIASRL
jgi:hypothetical protein